MSFIAPQLARPMPAKGHDAMVDYVIEPKYDGMRAVAVVADGKVDIYSRSGKSQNGKLPELEAELLRLFPAGVILDGELMHIGRTIEVRCDQVDCMDLDDDLAIIPIADFNKTMRVMGSGADKAAAKGESTPISMVVFDVLSLSSTSTVAASDSARREVLNELISGAEHLFLTPRFSMSDITTVYEAIVAAKGEGLIVKNPDAKYEVGGRPNHTWFKVKAAQTFDVVVTGFTDANKGVTGKFEGLIGAIEFSAYLPDGTLQYVGKCSGMNDAERRRWTTIRDSGDTTDRVIEVRANDLVGSGEYRTPRHPQFVTERIDKNPADCTMDQFKA